jgi:NADH dehydrogenase/NADH:ubiquinone oxidoreductase subunit G
METGLDDAIRQMSAAFRQALSGENRAKTAVIAAPQISSEALQLLKKMVDKLGIVNVDYRVPSVQAGELDNLLQMKDRNPNSYAAKNIGLIPAPGGKSFPEIIQWIKTGEIQNLLAICCNPLEFFGEADKKALERLKFFALLHWTKVPTVEFAHFVLPLATYVEYNGTFTNFQGREQRFFRAFVPLGEAIAPDEAFEKICKYS